MKKRDFATSKLAKAALLGMTASLFISAAPAAPGSEQAPGRTRRYNPQQQVAGSDHKKHDNDDDDDDMEDDMEAEEKMSCGGPGGCGS